MKIVKKMKNAALYNMGLFFIVCFSMQLGASEQNSLTLVAKKPSLKFLFSSQLQEDDKEKAKELLKQGADPNIKRYSQNSLLHSIIEQSDDPDTTLTFTQLLCEHNADVNIKNPSKETPLITAIKKGDEKTIELLLKQGAQPNIENNCGEYPIHIAMEWDTEHKHHFYKKGRFLPNIVKLLLRYKADPNMRYLFKQGTPLHAAVFHNSPEIVTELLRYGAKKEICDDRGYTPLTLAKQYGFGPIITILSQASPPLPISVIEGEIASFHLMEYKTTPLTIDTTEPFSNKNITDDYPQSTSL